MDVARVVFIHSSNEMFGADRMLLRVIETVLATRELIPEVWLPDDAAEAEQSIGKHLRALGVATHVLPLPIVRRKYLTPTSLPGLVARTIRVWIRLMRCRPAIVYCATSAALLSAPAARLAGVRSVVLHVQEIWSGREAVILGWCAAWCTSAIAISTASLDSLRGAIRGRSITILNAVEDRSDPAPMPIEPHDGPLQFLVASRWNSWKGHATLLSAWDSSDTPPGHLTIVGSPPEQGQGVDVEELVGRLAYPTSVTIAGQIDDITHLIDTSDFVLVPSDAPEPFGLVAIEAMSRFRAVIGTAGGGLGEMIKPGIDGLLFENGSVEHLFEILRDVDRSQAIELGASARSTFTSTFSIERFQAQFAVVWTKLIRGGADNARGSTRAMRRRVRR